MEHCNENGKKIERKILMKKILVTEKRLTNARSRAILIKLFLRQQVPQGITGFTHLPRNVRLIAMLSSPFPATGRGFFLYIT